VAAIGFAIAAVLAWQNETAIDEDRGGDGPHPYP
jgi:hypothetical protein